MFSSSTLALVVDRRSRTCTFYEERREAMAQGIVGLVVNGTMEVHLEDCERFAALVAQNVVDTEGVEGCILYAFAVNVRHPNIFHNIEAWTDQRALERHMKSTLMQTAFAEVKTLRILSREVTAYTVTNTTKL